MINIKIHPSAEVLTEKLGPSTTIWQNCVILQNAVIGANCNINLNVFIENDVVIGDNVTVKAGVQLWDGTRIEDEVFIGPNATFTNDLFPRSKKYPSTFLKTVVEKGASIGANSTILGGIIIGKYAMIGAGSVITKNVPQYELWYGNPARKRGFITLSGVILNNDLIDKDGNKYIMTQMGPQLVGSS